MRNLCRRVSALEGRRAPRFPQRVVVRYEGQEPDPSEAEIDENTLLVLVEYVDAPLPCQATEGAR